MKNVKQKLTYTFEVVDCSWAGPHSFQLLPAAALLSVHSKWQVCLTCPRLTSNEVWSVFYGVRDERPSRSTGECSQHMGKSVLLWEVWDGGVLSSKMSVKTWMTMSVRGDRVYRWLMTILGLPWTTRAGFHATRCHHQCRQILFHTDTSAGCDQKEAPRDSRCWQRDHPPRQCETTCGKQDRQQAKEFLEQPPYIPDLAPCDFHLFSPLKKFLAGQRFSCDDEVKAAVRQ